MPNFEFDQRDYGAQWPPEVLTSRATCSQCGRNGPVSRLLIEGMGQQKWVHACVECFFDIAAGTQITGFRVTARTTGGVNQVTWNMEEKKPVLTDLGAEAKELEALLLELKAIGNNDPHPFSEHYKAFLGENRARTEAIGKRLHELGGMTLMITAFEALRPHLPPRGPTHLNYAWHGIGEWLA